jgi:succinate dehydrogenase / fumarate reductase cytochrome b subunit
VKQLKGYRDNRLGPWGWLGGGRYGLERYLYAGQRISGPLILLYLIAHVIISGFRTDRAFWERLVEAGGPLNNPISRIFEFLLILIIVYHAFNGLRLILTELGLFVGRMERPVYPYKTSLGRQRPLTWALMFLGLVFLVVVAVEFFALPG